MSSLFNLAILVRPLHLVNTSALLFNFSPFLSHFLLHCHIKVAEMPKSCKSLNFCFLQYYGVKLPLTSLKCAEIGITEVAPPSPYIIPSSPMSSKWSLPSCFSTNKQTKKCMYSSSPIFATCPAFSFCYI
jgi:hypothetical protein